MQDSRGIIKVFSRYISKQSKQVRKPIGVKKTPVFEYPVASKSDKRVYVWGLAETGALGINEPKTTRKSFSSVVTHPTRISFAERNNVQDVACGYGFTLFSVKSKDVKVYGSGINTDSQIGYHTQRKDGILEYLTYPVPIILPLLEPEITNVLSVTCGRAHSIILTDREGVFTMGNNSYGQCGRPIDDEEKNLDNKSMPFPILKLGDEDITFIHAGQDHSIFINKSGKVFSCGWGADGQTGLGHYKNVHIPTQVLGDIALENIVKVAGSADCVLALNDKGQVFGWGNSEYGQLCQGKDIQQVNVPRQLSFCNQYGKIIDVAAGGSSCSIVNEDGDVFVWGFGILGQGPEIEHTFVPTRIPSVLFGKNDYNSKVAVTSIDSGLSNFAAVTNQGDLFTWGRNRHACLGLGHYHNQFFPFKVSAGAQVLKVSCGVDHTAILCKPHI